MAKEDNQKESVGKIGGLLFVGCILLGSGIGLMVGNIAAWSTIGVGVGFLVMAINYFIGNKKK